MKSWKRRQFQNYQLTNIQNRMFLNKRKTIWYRFAHNIIIWNVFLLSWKCSERSIDEFHFWLQLAVFVRDVRFFSGLVIPNERSHRRRLWIIKAAFLWPWQPFLPVWLWCGCAWLGYALSRHGSLGTTKSHCCWIVPKNSVTNFFHRTCLKLCLWTDNEKSLKFTLG